MAKKVAATKKKVAVKPDDKKWQFPTKKKKGAATAKKEAVKPDDKKWQFPTKKKKVGK